MKRISILSAAAILVSAVVAPSLAQAACALHDTGCATYPMPKKEGVTNSTRVRAEIGSQQPVDRSTLRTARVEQRADVGIQQPVVRSTARTARVERRENVREARVATDTGGPVRAAGAVAAGAAVTAGAIATAPFRAADSYAYYNEGYNGWDHRSYAERNGFVCTPGELFKGFDGRLHVCQ